MQMNIFRFLGSVKNKDGRYEKTNERDSRFAGTTETAPDAVGRKSERALARKNQTKHLAALGVMVKDFLPDIEGRDEEEIRDILREKLLSD